MHEITPIESMTVWTKGHFEICPKCDSDDVLVGDTFSTCMGFIGEIDGNWHNTACVCRSCEQKFSWHHKYNFSTNSVWHWYTIDGEVVKGVSL